MTSIHYITLHYIKKNIARECTLGSPNTLQEPTPSNSGCRVLNITKSSNLGEEGWSASLPHLMALELTNPGEHIAKCTVGVSRLHLTWLTALHPSAVTSEEASVISEVCASSTLVPDGDAFHIPSKSCSSLQSELGRKLMVSGVVLTLQLLSELQHSEQGAQHAQPAQPFSPSPPYHHCLCQTTTPALHHLQSC